MERREQKGSMLLDGALRVWYCPPEGRQFVWLDEVVVRLLKPDPNPTLTPTLNPNPGPNLTLTLTRYACRRTAWPAP